MEFKCNLMRQSSTGQIGHHVLLSRVQICKSDKKIFSFLPRCVTCHGQKHGHDIYSDSNATRLLMFAKPLFFSSHAELLLLTSRLYRNVVVVEASPIPHEHARPRHGRSTGQKKREEVPVRTKKLASKRLPSDTNALSITTFKHSCIILHKHFTIIFAGKKKPKQFFYFSEAGDYPVRYKIFLTA